MDHKKSNGFFISQKGAPLYKVPEYISNSMLAWTKTLTTLYSNPITFPSSLSPTQGGFVKSLITNIAPATVVEIGCYVGVSSIRSVFYMDGSSLRADWQYCKNSFN